MVIIKPISDLRNKSNEISALLDLLRELVVSQTAYDSGERGRPYQEVMKEARQRIHERKMRG